jgi:hypothetical protein
LLQLISNLVTEMISWLIRDHLLLAQDVMKDHQNHKRRHVEYSVGDWVLLKLHHRSAAGITSASPSKLAPRFFGPYQIIERIGAVAYRLRLPSKAFMTFSMLLC